MGLTPACICIGQDQSLHTSSIMSKKNRLCIYPKDIEIILDLSPRQAHRRYQLAKDAYGKQKHQELTFREFADYYGLPLDDIHAKLIP
ncbi:hypothetical protein [Sphingobacterium tabacisoli]|uniref:Uncharacterized protein n=1 Tax=Sphingobacterium tabacisoli TaxID=2044855 RepID=A0ABW5L1T6_9SPHI|nr:hypothetical protein [Sphingobacterium tabacisoli]